MAEVTHNPTKDRYEIHADGELAGFAEYTERGGRLYFLHTEIRPELHGQGLGSELVRRTLELVRDTGRQVVPLCPFIASYIERHPGFEDLVDTDLLARIDTPT
jgi:hypothetical protein